MSNRMDNRGEAGKQSGGLSFASRRGVTGITVVPFACKMRTKRSRLSAERQRTHIHDAHCLRLFISSSATVSFWLDNKQTSPFSISPLFSIRLLRCFLCYLKLSIEAYGAVVKRLGYCVRIFPGHACLESIQASLR